MAQIVDLRLHHIDYLDKDFMPEKQKIQAQKIASIVLLTISLIAASIAVYAWQFMKAKPYVILLTFKTSLLIATISVVACSLLAYHIYSIYKARKAAFNDLHECGFLEFEKKYVPSIIRPEELSLLINREALRLPYSAFIAKHSRAPFDRHLLNQESYSHQKDSFIQNILPKKSQEFESELSFAPFYDKQDIREVYKTHKAHVYLTPAINLLSLSKSAIDDLCDSVLFVFTSVQQETFKHIYFKQFYDHLNMVRQFNTLFIENFFSKDDIIQDSQTLGHKLQTLLKQIEMNQIASDPLLGSKFLRCCNLDAQDIQSIDQFIKDQASSFISKKFSDRDFESFASKSLRSHLDHLQKTYETMTYDINATKATIRDECEHMIQAQKLAFQRDLEIKTRQLGLALKKRQLHVAKQDYKKAKEDLVALIEDKTKKQRELDQLQQDLSDAQQAHQRLVFKHESHLQIGESLAHLTLMLKKAKQDKEVFLLSHPPRRILKKDLALLDQIRKLEQEMASHETLISQEESLKAEAQRLEEEPVTGLTESLQALKKQKHLKSELEKVYSSKLLLPQLQTRLASLKALNPETYVMHHPDISLFDTNIELLSEKIATYQSDLVEQARLEQKISSLSQRLRSLQNTSLINKAVLLLSELSLEKHVTDSKHLFESLTHELEGLEAELARFKKDSAHRLDEQLMQINLDKQRRLDLLDRDFERQTQELETRLKTSH